MRGPHAFVSPPPMSSPHRNLEPLGRWHATIHTKHFASILIQAHSEVTLD